MRRRVADEVLPELTWLFRNPSGGACRRINRSSNPLPASVPANDSSTTKTTRWPRWRRTLAMPTQLLVGPKAPSGKKTTVRGDVSSVIDLAVHPTSGPGRRAQLLISSRSAMVGITRLVVNERTAPRGHDRSDRRNAGRVRVGGGSAAVKLWATRPELRIHDALEAAYTVALEPIAVYSGRPEDPH